MRTRIVAVAVATAVGTGIVVPAVTAGSKPKPTFAVLKRAKTPKDDLKLSGRFKDLVVPGSTRFVGMSGSERAYIARGKGRRTCFLMADPAGGVGGGCIEESSLRNSAVYVGRGEKGGRVEIMIPVSDAYTDGHVEVAEKKAKAKNNVVLMNVPEKDAKIRITGKGGTLVGDLRLAPSPTE